MDSVLQALLSVQFVIFCLGLAAITFVVRRAVEFFLDKPWVPASKASHIWRGLVLPVMPVILGALFGFVASKYPYPEGLDTTSGRVMFGLVAGLLSGLIYRVIKESILDKIVKKPPTE
jgi:hypothetical protein